MMGELRSCTARWLILVACLGAAPRVTAQASRWQGMPGCPCVNPWVSWEAAEGGASVGAGAPCTAATAGADTVCVTEDYGAGGCSDWDQQLAPACVQPSGLLWESGQSGWCQTRWCYVDANNCNLHTPATTSDRVSFSNTAGLDPAVTLARSYETCGNVDTYSSERHYHALAGMHLKVSFPGDSSSGYTLLTLPDGTKDGSVVEFMRELAEEVGFTWEVHPVSNWSSTRYSSSFTACVHEVALGATDMCIGNFWMTAERLSLASFSPPLYDDEFRLLVKEDKEIDYWQMIYTPALPFTFSAWMYIIVIVMYCSIALFIINKGEIRRLGEIELDDEPSLSDNIAHMIHVDKARHRYVNFLEGGIEGIVKASYFGLLGFTGMAPANETTNFPGRIVTAGFSVFLMIIGATYTGATAAALVADQGGSNINSLDDVLRSGKNLCIRTAMSSNFLLRFPEFNGKLQMQDKLPDLLADMDNGLCLAAVVMSDGWDKTVANSPEHCSGSNSKMMLDYVLMSAGNGMPIRDELQQPLSFVIAAQIQAAKYFALQNEYKAEKVGFSTCKTVQSGNEFSDGVKSFKSMTEMDMFAPFAITFVMTSIGLMVFFGCGYVGLHIEDAGIGGVLDDKSIKKQLEGLTRSQLRDRAIAHIPDDDTDVHNASIKNSSYSLAHDVDHFEEGTTRTEAEDAAYQKANVLTRKKVYEAVNAFPDKGPLLTLVFLKECSTMRREMLALDKLAICELHDKCIFMGIPKEEADKCLNTVSAGRSHMLLIDLIIATVDKDGDGNCTQEEWDRAMKQGSYEDRSPVAGAGAGDKDDYGNPAFGDAEDDD